jgi:ABC-type antimicrobial peptide transport system permease subunit
MIGVVIALSIISGVLFYLDSSTASLITNAVEDVTIDMSVSQTAEVNITEMQELAQYLETEFPDLVSNTELITGSTPLNPVSGGATVMSHSDDAFVVNWESFKSAEADYSVTYIFAVEPSYFDTYDFLSTTANVSEIFARDEIFISTDLAVALDQTIGDTCNMSLWSGIGDVSSNATQLYSTNLTIGGEIKFDISAVVNSLDAFYPSWFTGYGKRMTALVDVPNCIVMSHDMYLELLTVNSTYYVNATFPYASSAIDFNSVQLKIDHSQLSADVSTVYSQLNLIDSRMGVFYPDTVVINLLEAALTAVENELNQMRLFLIYFALPGLLLGGYITKYATDLSIEEREREIGILRSKAARRKQIALSIGIESSVIALIGLVVGIAAGYAISLLITSVLGNGNGSIVFSISPVSLGLCVGIGIVIAIGAAVLASRQLLVLNVAEAVKEAKEDKIAIWKKIYLDFLLLGVVIFIYVMNMFEFNPIPGFATTIYDFLAPLLTWLGLTLLLVRGLGYILQLLEEPITKIYRFLFKDLGVVIVKNILYRPQQISKIIIVLSLTLSFGLVIASVSETYQLGAVNDVRYQVGSDIRIAIPSSDYMNYNTSNLQEQLLSNFTDEIAGVTPIYLSSIQLGRGNLLVIGIDPDTFFDVCTMDSAWFYSGSIESVITSLKSTNVQTGSYSNIIFSEGLASPDTQNRAGGRTGKPGDTGKELDTYEIGEELPVTVSNMNLTIYVADIVDHFPAIIDIASGKLSEEQSIPFAVSNVDYLIDPDSSNGTILQDQNATYFLLSVNNGVDIDALVSNIETWYDTAYPDSLDLGFTTTTGLYEIYSPLITSLLGLTTMEFILVITVSALGLEIFLTSSLYERKKEFGTYFAIGGPIKAVNKLVLGEISLVVGFSIITGSLLSVVVSTMYLGFISDLLVLEVISIVIPSVTVILILLMLISMIIAIILSNWRLSKLDPTSVLRTV